MRPNKLSNALSHSWSLFKTRSPTNIPFPVGSKYQNQLRGVQSYTLNPDRPRLTGGNERSITTAIYNRIAIDCSLIKIKHCIVDENDNFVSEIQSTLNRCLTLEANIDQTATSFLMDAVISMLDEGCVAIVPTEADRDPDLTSGFKIKKMRVAKILEWYPEHVRVKLWNEKRGVKEEMVVPKRTTAIVENPLYSIINEPNSVMKRLVNKLNLLDAIDEQVGSGRLNLILQLPYPIRTEKRKIEAEERLNAVQYQLTKNKLGAAYIDATEKVTQLNKPLENDILNQVKYLTELAFSQLGLTQEILNGTAKEEEMLNYTHRTIEPIIMAIVNEMKRKFLTETARTQGQSIKFFSDPFNLVTLSSLVKAADVFTRNEIMTGNEVRTKLGLEPSTDPTADMLMNKNNISYEQESPIDPSAMETQYTIDDPEAELANMDQEELEKITNTVLKDYSKEIEAGTVTEEDIAEEVLTRYYEEHSNV